MRYGALRRTNIDTHTHTHTQTHTQDGLPGSFPDWACGPCISQQGCPPMCVRAQHVQKISIGEVSQILAARWKKLTDATKDKYNVKAQKARVCVRVCGCVCVLALKAIIAAVHAASHCGSACRECLLVCACCTCVCLCVRVRALYVLVCVCVCVCVCVYRRLVLSPSCLSLQLRSRLRTSRGHCQDSICS